MKGKIYPFTPHPSPHPSHQTKSVCDVLASWTNLLRRFDIHLFVFLLVKSLSVPEGLWVDLRSCSTLCSYVTSVCFCTWETLLALKKLWQQLRNVSCVSETFSTDKIQSAFEKHYLRNIICIWTSLPAFKKEEKNIRSWETLPTFKEHCLRLRNIVCTWEALFVSS